MGDWSTTRLLLVVNGYVFLAFALLVLSGSDLLCQLRKGNRCARRHRLAKFFVAAPLALSCLALLAIGLFAVGVSHGSQPKTYQVVLFILGCLTPCLLLLSWVFGSLVVDCLWSLLACLLLFYFSFFNPALYIRYWADDNYQWAQMWMARHYETGGGGLDRLESSASMYQTITTGRAAGEKIRAGDPDTLYRKAQDFLDHPAKDQVLHDRAITYLRRAVESNHSEAAVLLAKLAGDQTEAGSATPETIGWLEIAAAGDNIYALGELAGSHKKSRKQPG
jgi:hypothetical protein